MYSAILICGRFVFQTVGNCKEILSEHLALCRHLGPIRPVWFVWKFRAFFTLPALAPSRAIFVNIKRVASFTCWTMSVTSQIKKKKPYFSTTSIPNVSCIPKWFATFSFSFFETLASLLFVCVLLPELYSMTSYFPLALGIGRHFTDIYFSLRFHSVISRKFVGFSRRRMCHASQQHNESKFIFENICSQI